MYAQLLNMVGRVNSSRSRTCSGACATLFILVLTLTSCIAPPTGSPPTSAATEASQAAPVSETDALTIVHTDDALAVPTTIPAGLHRVMIRNNGQEWHASILRRLKDDVTMEEFEAAFLENPFGSLSLTTQMGGPDLAPSTSSENMFRFEPGSYVVVDNWTEPPRMQSFIVTGEGESDESAPEVAVMVEMREHEFMMPDTIQTGPQWWQFHNTGDAMHLAGVAQLVDGATLDDIIAWFETEEGPPPWVDVAFWNVMSPGQQSWGEIDLLPGEYLLLDYLPDFNNDGTPNFMLGMAQEFVVAE